MGTHRKNMKKAPPHKKSPVYAVIMAGGTGTRFWPMSREKMPKQLLKLFTDKPLIVETVERWHALVGKKNIFISTNPDLKKRITPLLKGVPFILEPHPRNTAACIGLACITLMRKSKDAIIAFLPSDHYIPDREQYSRHIKTAVEYAKQAKVVILGIKPLYPATEYGYIQKGIPLSDKAPRAFSVQRFVEKPDADTAKSFLASQDYYWNSGQFVARADVMLDAIHEHMPRLYDGLMTIQSSGFKENVVEKVFRTLESVSIDYGVMERLKEVAVIEGNFHWDDVGSWTAMSRIYKQDAQHNVVKGNTAVLDTHDSIILGGKKLIAAVGVHDLIVIDTPDALLICDKGSDQKLKELQKKLPEKYK